MSEPAYAAPARQESPAGEPLALLLGSWAASHAPSAGDEELAHRALLDTVCVALAARDHPTAGMASALGRAGRWATMAHALDYDDLHLPSTAHLSAVCAPTALAYRGEARAYLAGAGVMARIGTLLGWSHYAAGWHTTATAGVFGAAAAAAVSLGLSAEEIAAGLALSVAAAGGVQRAFGTDAKPLQVGMAADAGATAAELAARGARADLAALEDWLGLVQASAAELEAEAESIPGGLAVKIFPCCYALQRPILAVRSLRSEHPLEAGDIVAIEVRTPQSTVQPLIHHRPGTGPQGKFSLEYGVAAAVLDEFPGLWSFTDAAVRRPSAQALLKRVRFVPDGLGAGLLDGTCRIAIEVRSGDVLTSSLDVPEGAPDRPPSSQVLAEKAASSLADSGLNLLGLDWSTAASLLEAHTP